LKEEYSFKIRFVDYDTFIDKLEVEGLRSPMYPWLDFYNAANALYGKIYKHDIPDQLPFPFMRHGITTPETFFRHMKLERLYSNTFLDMIEKPLEVVRKDIEYGINNANKLFAYPF